MPRKRKPRAKPVPRTARTRLRSSWRKGFILKNDAGTRKY